MGKDNSTSWHDFTYDFDAVFADVSKLANDIRLRARNRIMEALDVNNLLSHAATFIHKQAPVAGFRRDGDVIRQIFPLAAGFENV